MAAILISDGIVTCAAGVATEVAADLVARVGGAIQNRSKTTSLMCRLDAVASANLGFEMTPGAIVPFGTLIQGPGNNTDNFQGTVSIFNPSTKAIDVFVAEGRNI